MDKVLFTQFQKTEKYKTVFDNVKKRKRQLLQGLNEEGLAYLACNLSDNTVDKILILTSNESKSKKFEEEIKTYTSDVKRLLPKEFILYNVDALSKDIDYQRTNIFDRIISTKKIIVTASVNSIATRVMSKDRFKKYIIELKYGKSYDLNELKSNLIKLKYERVDAVEGIGQFSVRGGIIDIFSPSETNPCRIEFFDDEIDSIRLIDIKTQRSVKNQKSIKIIPCSDVIFEEDEIKKVLSEVEKDNNKRLGKIKSLPDSKEAEKRRKNLFNSYNTNLSEGFSIENADMLVA